MTFDPLRSPPAGPLQESGHVSPSRVRSRARLLQSLLDATEVHPLERKLLVCRTLGEGRELLASAARAAGGWLGWEPTTPLELARELAFVELAGSGLRLLDDIERRVAVDAALARSLGRVPTDSPVHGLARGPGGHLAAERILQELREGDLDAARLKSFLGPAPRAAALAVLLEEYTRELETRGTADAARVYRCALATCDDEAPFLGSRIFLASGLRARGLAGALLRRLLDRGAVLLQADPVIGVEPLPGLLLSDLAPDSSAAPVHGSTASGRSGLPGVRASGADRSRSTDVQLTFALGRDEGIAEGGDSRPSPLAWLYAAEDPPPSIAPVEIEMFRASSPAVEIREVFRRIVAEGRRWDDVEIVATDPVLYGCLVDGFATRLEIPVTYAVGLPLRRTRLGRALEGYLSWLENGLPARRIWEALDRGEIAPPGVGGAVPSASGVGRALRRLRIGWQRERWAQAASRLQGEGGAPERGAEEADAGDEALTASDARRRVERASLLALLDILNESVPAGIEGDTTEASTASCVTAADVARGARQYLRLFSPATPAETDAFARVLGVLDRIVAVASAAQSAAGALAELRAHLEMRVPTAGTPGRQPWRSAGGAVHVTDLPHGGRSDRRRVFVVGLDAQRSEWSPMIDPLLGDRERRILADALGPDGGVAAIREGLLEERYEIAAMLASLRGRLTLSYSAWDASTGSELAPSPILLMALRVRERNRSLSFQDLEAALGSPVSPVPVERRLADGLDVWLSHLSRGALLLDGTQLVRAGFAGLAAGLDGLAARNSDTPNAWHGWLDGEEGLETIDPAAGRPVSARGLELLGQCALSWFYREGLGVRAVDDPEPDPGRWLSAAEKGGLLHDIFHAFGREFRDRRDEITDRAADEALASIVEDAIERWRRDRPAPGPAAFAADAQDVRETAATFLRVERAWVRGRWEFFELPLEDVAGQPATIHLPGGSTLRVRGRVDRVDRLTDGSLHVIDYKTGSTWKIENSGPGRFGGGRLLQPIVYALAVEALLGRPVTGFEYRFPTVRSGLLQKEYSRSELEEGASLLADLVALVSLGRFLPTDDANDCKWCEHRVICRVEDSRGDPESPPAAWSAARLDTEALERLRRVRGKG